ncbi:MAG TPA: hypothetical protein VGR24_10265 [bacterium]|jgi:hypothetical protein|nr:hypothetical protein [bacterium]
MTRWRRYLANEDGSLLPMALGVLLVTGMIAVMFTAYVVTRQQLAAHRYRTLAGRYVAEAGVERALWALQRDPGGGARLRGLSEVLESGSLQGTFTVDAVTDNGGGLFEITSSAVVRGARRAIRATAKLSPPVLRFAMFGSRLLRFEGTSRTYVVPGASVSTCADVARLSSNGEIWLVNEGVAINDFNGTVLPLREGNRSDHALLGNGSATPDEPTGQIVVPKGASITFGSTHYHLEGPFEIPRLAVSVGASIVDGTDPQELPAVDTAALRALAAANAANAGLNENVGRRFGRAGLRLKRDSSYGREEFELIVAYLAGAPAQALTGPVFVRGPVVIPESAEIRVRDGFLAAEGSLRVAPGALLDVRHSPRSRLFPGVVTIGETAPLVVQQGAVLIADGLVYAERIFDAGEGAVIDIVGALIGADPLLSFRNHSATVVIRYDPAVLGTVGIRPPAGAGTIARIIAWTEVR